ncbi:hypothetical protein [Methylomonas rivi]|uniref:Uncharacterized protein n=1 Tax=Methylomonas rivi TaxID=2952226 RepID=A0ABT1U9F2_9GAMM|nr:hypothetical protein [Methylomonas sp. WSC-6]MCQ8130485.1 hypothetical protein [Methylomonas sp. WSC-6]
MSSDDDRKKVALDDETYEKLKDFSRFNGLKLRKVIATLADLLVKDKVLSDQVIKLTLEK